MNCSTAPDAIAGTQQLVICVVSSGPPEWSYLPAFVTPVLGLFALYFAWQNILNARDLARNKATLDLIEKRESTEHYRAINNIFSRLRKTGGFTHLNDPATEADIADRQAVVDYLNHYEMVAIGIERKLLDATLYRRWMEGAYVRDWNAAVEWVQRERWKADDKGNWTYRASILGNFQQIACKWSAEAKRLTKDSSPPPDKPSGTADAQLPAPIDDIDPAT